MQAIILAAGMGKRLGDLTMNNTKCMVKVNGIILIDRLLKQLSNLKLDKIIFVIGYKGDQLKKHVGFRYNDIPIEYVENTVYDKTNNIYSLYLAKNFLQADNTLLLESDLIFEESILSRMISAPDPNMVAVAKYENWMDGTVVELDCNNRVLSFIPKNLFLYEKKDTYYKTVNIYKFSKEFSQRYYLPFLEAYIKSLGNSSYYEEVLRVITMIDKTGLKAFTLEDEKWYEIDDIQDLDIAETLFAEHKSDLYHKRYGGYWRFPHLIDFCYLVNPYFPTNKFKEEMRSNFDCLLTEYPSGMNINNLLLSKMYGINKDLVCVGNGAAELIKCFMRYIDGKVGIVTPTFEEYMNRYDSQQLVSFVPNNENYAYTVNDLMEFYQDKDVKTLLLINPDNPSGNFISLNDIIKVTEWSRERHIRLVVDESFVDFSDDSTENTLLRNEILFSFENLVVIKSLSKSHGIPGLRLGLLATSDFSLLEKIRKDIPIWNINSFAEYYMQIFGKYESDYQNACTLFIKERDRFYKALLKVDYLKVIPSQANYFLCKIVNKYAAEDLVEILLNEYNILVKNCSSKVGFNHMDYIRIAIRTECDNNKLVKALLEL